MITLAATNILSGIASAANEVTCTIFGMELNSGTEVYKPLYQGQLAASASTLYTAPSGTQTFIKSIMVVNTGTVVRTFSLFQGGTAASNAITPTMSLLPGGMGVYEDARGWQFYNSSGQLLFGAGGSSNGAKPNYGPTNNLAETIDRNILTETNTAAPTASGTLFMQAIYLTTGIVVSNITMSSATTAANTPTAYLVGLYDANRNLLATSANQGSAAWGANTVKTFAMTTPYNVTSTGLYYIGFSMTAATVITTKGNTAITNGVVAALPPILHGASSTGLTTSLPNPAAAITSGLVIMWAAVS